MSWREAPIVSFARNGEEITLGRSGHDSTLHLHGSEGLGIAPVQTSKSDRLGGDGSVVRGIRYGDREVFIPLRVHMATMGDLTTWRRKYTRLLAPTTGDVSGSLVDVRIQDPVTGSDRTVRGLYKDGMAGDFGDDFLGRYQTFGVTLDCTDPWWLGPERLRTLRVAPGTKPFISQTVPFFPMVLAPSNVVGEWEIDVQGDAEVWPSWEVVGPGRDLLIQSGGNRLQILGEFPSTPTLIQTRPRRITPRERFRDMQAGSTLFPLQPGPNRIKVEMTGADANTVVRLVYRERYLEGI